MAEAPTPIPFGFLPCKWTIEFDNGIIVPVPKFNEAEKDVAKWMLEDDYFYPPRTIRETKTPIHLYRLPASHNLTITPAKPEDNVRTGSAGFVLHLLAFMFGTRLQFADWFFDGRIRMRQSVGIGGTNIDHNRTGHALSHAYKIWSRWPEPEQKRFINILYMFSRVESYQWDWEKFMIQYTVFEGCWKMGEELHGWKSKGHWERPKILFEKLSMPNCMTPAEIETMVDLRNNFFHETLWYDGRPGSAHPERGACCMALRLGSINEQIIARFLELL